jgi:hypothetical protein
LRTIVRAACPIRRATVQGWIGCPPSRVWSAAAQYEWRNIFDRISPGCGRGRRGPDGEGDGGGGLGGLRPNDTGGTIVINGGLHVTVDGSENPEKAAREVVRELRKLSVSQFGTPKRWSEVVP